MMNRYLTGIATVLICAVLGVGTSASAAEIAWISFHPTDDPVADAVNQGGFSEASDLGYVNLLRDSGHSVTRFVTAGDLFNTASPSLNTFDLVIVSRQVNSGHYMDETQRMGWHGITAPMMFMSGYVNRQNRLQFMAGDTIPDTQGPVTLTATQPGHPIFSGITLDGTNSMPFADYPVLAPNGTEQRGISVVTGDIATGGTVLATVGASDNPETIGGMLISHFPAGTVLGNHALAADRMIFLSGSREHDGAGIPVAGIMDLTPAGEQLFLNAVNFFTGPPPLFGDVNGDGVVDLDDFEIIRMNFRLNVGSREQGDLTGNGFVGFPDFQQWKSAFLGMGGSLEGVNLSFAGAVPEPSSLVLLLAGLAGLVGLRRRRL